MTVNCNLTYSGQHEARKTEEKIIKQLRRPAYIHVHVYSSTLTRAKQTTDIY